MERPQRVLGSTPRIRTGCGYLYMTESNPNEEYQEIFCKLGKSGCCACAFLDGIGRLITFALHAGVTRETIGRAFRGIQCPSPIFDGPTQVLSCLDGIAKLIESYKEEKKDVNP